MSNYNLVKIIVIGDSGVGKTSILHQYCFSKFDFKVFPTIGCDFLSKNFEVLGHQTIKLQLWDIAGQESFQTISKLFIRGSLGCIIVTDATNLASFKNSLKWKELVEENCDYYNDRSIPTILVQNKLDLISNLDKTESEVDKIVFDKKIAKQFAKENGFLSLVQVSAKDNKNIEKIFNKLMNEIKKRGLLDDERKEMSEGNRSFLNITRDLISENPKKCSC